MRGKTRQNAENKQTLIFSGKIEIELRGKFVKTLKINKLLNFAEKIKIEEKTRQNAENKKKKTLIFFGKPIIYVFCCLLDPLT